MILVELSCAALTLPPGGGGGQRSNGFYNLDAIIPVNFYKYFAKFIITHIGLGDSL